MVAHILFVVCAIGLAAHRLPGFHNIELIESVRTSINSIPFSLYLNLDKIHVGLAVVLIFYRSGNVLPNHSFRVLGIVVALLLIQLASVPFGLMHFDFSLPDWLLIWLSLNLLTCFAEEAFFRGYLQLTLQGKLGFWPGLLLTSILFGVAHFAGGLLFVVFATLAGLGYGLVFSLTSRLRYAILTHLTFNLFHLIFYTYPMPI